MTAAPVDLNKGASVTLDSTGAGTVTLGPDQSRGPSSWTVDGALWQNFRAGVLAAGVAPIPKIIIYLGGPSIDNLQAQSYDGSFGSAHGSINVARGQFLTVTWSGGASGDVASISVTGTAS